MQGRDFLPFTAELPPVKKDVGKDAKKQQQKK